MIIFLSQWLTEAQLGVNTRGAIKLCQGGHLT